MSQLQYTRYSNMNNVNIKKIIRMIMVFTACILINSIGVSAGTGNAMPSATLPAMLSSIYKISEETPVIHSGNYDYQIVNEQQKLIALRKIYNYGEEVVFPSEIDGYSVYQIGADETNAYRKLDSNLFRYDYSISTVFANGTDSIKRIIIPEGIEHIGYRAIDNVANLKELELPTTLRTLDNGFLNNSKMLKSVEIKSALYVGGSAFGSVQFDEVIVENKLSVNCEDGGFAKEIDKLIIKASENAEISVSLTETWVNDVIVEKGVKKASIGDVVIKNNLYCMDKNTELFCYRELVNMVVTVKNSKAMKYCKSQKINYTFDNILSVNKIKVKKKDGKYVYSWKKIKPKKQIYRYDEKNREWNRTYKPLKCKYEIKAKSGKSKKYVKIKNTKKTKWTTSKKVKVKVKCVLKKQQG